MRWPSCASAMIAMAAACGASPGTARGGGTAPGAASTGAVADGALPRGASTGQASTGASTASPGATSTGATSKGATSSGSATSTGATSTRADRDGDEVADADDRCPDAGEDFDVWQDDDGCPDPDDDGDGVADEADVCTYTPGTAPSGCPARCSVLVVDRGPCRERSLAFADDVADDAALRALIDEVRRNPEIREVTLRTTRTSAEAAGAEELRLEPVCGRLRALGWPRRVGLELGSRAVVDDADERAWMSVEITRQRFASGVFRAPRCTALGIVWEPARRGYRCPEAPR